MKKSLFFALCLLVVSISANAQNRKNGFAISASPYGHAQIKLSMENEKYKYDYKNLVNAGILYDHTIAGMASLTELSYFRATYDKMDLGETVSTTYFNPNCTENIFGASLTEYIGATINPKGTFQIPVYLGIGADYINNGDFLHHFTGNLAGKLRLKLYLGDIGFFVGGSGRVGFGIKGSSDYQGYHIITTMWNAEGGVEFRL